MLVSAQVAAVLAFSGLSGAAIVDLPAWSSSSVPEIPLLGFGTWDMYGNTTDIVAAAIKTGFRHIDGATAYGNHVDVGKGIKKGLAEVGLGREDIWVTSKLPNDRHAPLQVPITLQETLNELDLEYLDLYLMHWPVASKNGKNSIDFIDTWKAMTLLLATGKVRHIGISNFDPSQLRALLDSPAGRASRPYAHQMEMHPYLPQQEFLDYHQTYGVHVTAYSPLANSNPIYKPGQDEVAPLLKNKVILKIAEERGCTPAQVALKWGLVRKTSVIPKSSHLERIEEDFEATKCGLKPEDFVTLSEEMPVKRLNNPSESWKVPLFEGLEGTSTFAGKIAEKVQKVFGMAVEDVEDL